MCFCYPITYLYILTYIKKGVTVTLDDNNNNTQYSAKYGIVTFSLGVLQSDIVEFGMIFMLVQIKVFSLISFLAQFSPEITILENRCFISF